MTTPILVEELAGDRTAAKNADNSRDWTRVFIVAYASTNTNLPEVQTAFINENTRLPRVGEGYPGFPSVTVRKIDPSDVNDEARIFNVTIEYSNDGTASSKENAFDPLKKPWDYSFGFEPEDKIVRIAKSSKTGFKKSGSVSNAAGIEFDPPIIRKDFDLVISLTKNFKLFPLARAVATLGTMNDQEITIAGYTIPKRHGRIRRISAGNKQFESEVSFFAVTHEILIKAPPQNKNIKYLKAGIKRKDISPFDEEFINNGFEFKNSKDVLQKITTNHDDPVKPLLLTDTGGYDPKKQDPEEDLKYFAFRIYEETDWSDFKFPQGQSG